MIEYTSWWSMLADIVDHLVLYGGALKIADDPVKRIVGIKVVNDDREIVFRIKLKSVVASKFNFVDEREKEIATKWQKVLPQLETSTRSGLIRFLAAAANLKVGTEVASVLFEEGIEI